jgi:hypothetical protein
VVEGDRDSRSYQLPEGISGLAAMQANPECHERFAEKPKRRFLGKEVDSDCPTGGRMIIERRLISRYPRVDFAHGEVDPGRVRARQDSTILAIPWDGFQYVLPINLRREAEKRVLGA